MLVHLSTLFTNNSEVYAISQKKQNQNKLIRNRQGTLFTNVCRSCATTAVLRRRRGSVVATIRLILDRRRKYSRVSRVRRRAYDLSRQLIHGSFAIYSTYVIPKQQVNYDKTIKCVGLFSGEHGKCIPTAKIKIRSPWFAVKSDIKVTAAVPKLPAGLFCILSGPKHIRHNTGHKTAGN